MTAIASRAGASGAPRSSTARTIRHSSGMRTENRSRISSRVSTGMCALRLRSRTSRPSWQRVWIASRTVGRATPNSAASSASGRRAPGAIDAVEDAGAQRGDDGLAGGDRLDGETAHQAPRGSAGAGYVGERSRPARPARRRACRRCAPPPGATGRVLTYRIASGSASISAGRRRRPRTRRRTGTSARGLSPRDTASTRAARTRARAPRPRAPPAAAAPCATTRASSSSPSRPDAVAALAGEPLEPARQPVAAGQRLHAAAQHRAAVERALAVAASQLRTPRPRWPRSSRPACRGRRTRRPRSSSGAAAYIV